MSGRPALTWGWVKDWAVQNKVAGDALAEDDGRGRVEFYQVSWQPMMNLMVLHHQREPMQEQLRWEDILRIAGDDELRIPDDARLEDDSDMGSDSRIVDIGWFEAEPPDEPARLVLQHRWG